jgi:DNA polymerase-3 subunit gamma/tau
MCAKILVPAANATEVGSLARIERLERRIGIGGETSAPAAAVSAAPAPASAPAAPAPVASTPVAEPSAATTPIPVISGGVTISQVRASWPRILEQVSKKSKKAYMVAYTIDVIAVEGDVLTLRFASNYDLESFKGEAGAPDVLRKAIEDEFGIVFKFKPLMQPKAEQTNTAPVAVAAAVVAPAVVAEPEEAEAPTEPEATAESRNANVDEDARYGESLLREILGAEPLDD